MFWQIFWFIITIVATSMVTVLIYRAISPFNRAKRVRGFLENGSGQFYDFVSFDGGKNWFEVREEGGKVLILGPTWRNEKSRALFHEVFNDFEVPDLPPELQAEVEAALSRTT